VPEVRSGISLDVGSVGCVVDDVTSGIGWGISYRVGALAAALAAGLTGCATSFLPRPSSATRSRGPWLRRHWRGRSNLLLE
jgi:hypothetical protein